MTAPPLQLADPRLRVILIGGTSHVGKSTLARYIADTLDWALASTDQLARHPGRPWGPVPPQVMLHYLKLDQVALVNSVLAHYRGMAPAIGTLVRHREGSADKKLVLEGSALLPETMSNLRDQVTAVIMLVGDDALIDARIRSESDYANRNGREAVMIDKFIARSKAFNRIAAEGARDLGIPLLFVDEDIDPAKLAERCLASMQSDWL